MIFVENAAANPPGKYKQRDLLLQNQRLRYLPSAVKKPTRRLGLTNFSKWNLFVSHVGIVLLPAKV